MKMSALWDELCKLDINDEIKLEYKAINEMINDNPDKLVTDFDALFNFLSIERMKQLAKVNQVKEISMNYFTSDNLKSAWQLFRSNMNCSLGEYTKAFEYCKISEMKFKRNLTFTEAQTAFKSLMTIAKIWSSQRLAFEVGIDESSSEVAVTAEALADRSAESKVMYTPASEKPRLGKTDFLSILSVLQSSSKESVVHADSFGELRDYMHVERTIQLELEKMLTEVSRLVEPSLILLCGSVGDGKSHLLAFMKEKYPELLEGVVVHNDSTESFDPDQNSLDTLEQILSPFDGDTFKGNSVIIAINLGVLHNFHRRQREAGRFNALCDFMERCGIFERTEHSVSEEGAFKLLNFAETQPYKLTENGTTSPFFLSLLNKLTNTDMDNPFYKAWFQDVDKGLSSAAHENYYLLQQSNVKESIVQSLIEAMIKQKVFISTRTLYNFLYEIIVPVNNKVAADSKVEVQEMLPNLMYGHPDRSPLLEALHEVDPLKTRMESTDRLVSDFILSSIPSSFVNDKLGETSGIGTWKQVSQMGAKGQQMEYSRLLIRHHELLNKQAYDESYCEYVNYLHAFYKGEADEIGALFELLEQVVFAWKGSPKDKFVFMDSPNKNFRMAVEINIEPEVDELTFASSADRDVVDRFYPSIRIGFSENNERFLFELDYQLYLLLKRVGNGYRPNRQDIQYALQFSEFHDKILKSADKTKNILLVHKNDGAILEVKKPRFSKAKFEVEKVN